MTGFSDITLMEWFMNALFVCLGFATIYATHNVTKKFSSINLPSVAAGAGNGRYCTANVIMPNARLIVDGKQVDRKQYKQFLVDGDSMKNFGIYNNDVVLVSMNENIEELKGHPVILVKERTNNNSKENYKLRRFYMGNKKFTDIINFKEWLQNENVIMERNVEDYRLQRDNGINEKIEKSNQSGKDLVISITTYKDESESKRKSHLSVHLIDDIAGVVKYRVPNEKINVLRKK